MEKIYFKAFIRVVKSISGNSNLFSSENIIYEPMILAESKDEVKKYLLSKYPQFFQNGKIYTKECKDEAQFFYVVIYPLYENEKELIKEGSWTCAKCGQVWENKYILRPITTKIYADLYFCDDECKNKYTQIYMEKKGINLLDNEHYIKKDSPIYIYKITENTTNKSYIGKTKNEPFFRWWDHLTKNNSPFGVYLRSTKLTDWTFQVIDILPPNICDSDVFRIESEYILLYNSIKNGFNTTISNKNVVDKKSDKKQLNLF